MGEFEEAKSLYATTKMILADVKHAVELDDSLRWLLEDMEDALFDLKEAVIATDPRWTRHYTAECRSLLTKLDEMLG